MKNRNVLISKALTGALAAAMVFGTVPAAALAETGDSVQTESTADAETATKSDAQKEVQYVLMNIPYAQFYEAELNGNSVAVDAVSSATKTKPRTGSLVGGSYHAKSDGSEITGVIFPVKVDPGVDLSNYKQVTDDAKVEITVTNRGQTSTTVYEGKNALFESASYSYYELNEIPAYYKEVTVENGKLKFSKVEEAGERTEVTATAELLTTTAYGDYQLNLDSDTISDIDQVSGIVLHTEEGDDYALRHLENIWQKTKMAWSTGFTTTTHGNTLSYAHYKAIMGQTIESITYYTTDGIYEVALDESVYVPVKFKGDVSVDDALASAGTTKYSVSGLPSEYEASYAVTDAEGEEIEATAEDGVLTYPDDTPKGEYTFTVSDDGDKYADLSTTFILYADSIPAAFNEDDSEPALIPAGTDDEFADYIKNIQSVSVNGTSYAKTGHNAKTIINEGGTVNTEDSVFAEAGSYTIIVSSVGYKDLEFSFDLSAEKEIYILMNIPYAKFYEADLNNDVEVDAVSSATLNKPRTGTLAGGSYHVNSDGSDITGVVFPVKVGSGVDLSGYKKLTDEDSVEITVTNRGQTVTSTYTGKDALFESASYSYYILSEVPDYYKVMTADGNGEASFGKIQGTAETIDGTGTELSAESKYGDYQLTVAGLELDMNSDQVYGVILNTKEGSSYGLRHVQNIWRGTNLAWSVGITTESHGCKLSYEHYKTIVGQTITSITYYTSKGIYEITLGDEGILVPEKSDEDKSEENTVSGGSTGSSSSSSSSDDSDDDTTSRSTTISSSETNEGTWVARTNADGSVSWLFRRADGSGSYTDSWAYISNPYAGRGTNFYSWFHFASDGSMQTGWLADKDGNYYYLNPNSDGTLGMMLTGWQFINGTWYYFHETEGGPLGSLLVNGVTPDGYQVGADGAWIR